MKTIVCALLFVSAGVAAQSAVPKDLEKFQGTWTVTSAAGQELPAGTHAGLIFTGDKYQGVTNGKADERGAVKVNAATTPMTIDLLVAEGPSAGKTQLGVVEIAADTMTMVLAEPGVTVRPNTQSPEKLILTRVKPIAKNLEGSWAGAVEAGGRSWRLTLKLSNGPDGLATGTFISVDQGGGEAPIAAVVQMGARLKLVIPAIRGTYDGELKDGQVTGTWSQGPQKLPLVWKRPAG